MADDVVEFGRDGWPVEPGGAARRAGVSSQPPTDLGLLKQFLAGQSGDVLEADSRKIMRKRRILRAAV